MSQSFFTKAGPLFAEDFDAPPAPAAPPEPEIVEPVYSAADLVAAREEAAREARATTLAETEAATKTTARRALSDIAAQIAAAREDVAMIAEQSAEATARLLLDCFATAFPTLSARHGAAEVTAILRAVLPTLRREPKILVRLSPHLAREMTEEIQMLDPEIAAHVRIIPTDAVPEGDVRIAWDNGGAARDTKALWSQIESILAPAGLLTATVTAKEHAFVD